MKLENKKYPKFDIYRLFYTIFTFGALLFFLFRLSSEQPWLQTELATLLPKQQTWTELQQQVEKHQEKLLNQQVIALIGHSELAQAIEVATQISQQWKQSDAFEQIQNRNFPELTQLQSHIQRLSLATLPIPLRKQLLNDPKEYFQQYAQQFLGIVTSPNLLPLEQDWLGFARFTLPQSQIFPQLQWDSQSGMIYVHQNQKYWILLRGTLLPNSKSLLKLIEQNKQLAELKQGKLIVASSAIFASYAKQSSEQESSQMATLGISLTLLLLLVIFKTWRIIFLFLPIAIGMITGTSITLLIFGQIHILTLVIATSLVGVLIDFPLHWLSTSLGKKNWQPHHSMMQLKKPFLISLLVTVIGYIMLSFTSLPILQQTALFSAVALVSAIGFTLFYLPLFFRNYNASKGITLAKERQFSPKFNLNKWKIFFRVILPIIAIIGIAKSQWTDDIKQWVNFPQNLTSDLAEINAITQIELGSQYFIIKAENAEQLLIKSEELTNKLEAIKQQGKIEKIQSLNHWIMSKEEQQKLIESIAQQPSENFRPLIELGFPMEKIQQFIHRIEKEPSVDLESALESPLGQGWQSLYLGEILPNQFVGLIKISGIKDGSEMAKLANHSDIFWQDKRAMLNKNFQQTRNDAGLLKLLSLLLASLFLYRLFGTITTVKILTVPIVASALVIATFGYLSIPIGLFTMFGLLLIMALSIDYTAFMHTAKEPLVSKQRAIILSGLTTILSFVLLAFSATPAVAQFGLSVSLGIFLSLIMTLKYFK